MSFLIIERSSEMEGPRKAVYSSIIESKRLRFLLLVFLIFAGPNPRAMLDALSETFNTGHRRGSGEYDDRGSLSVEQWKKTDTQILRRRRFQIDEFVRIGV